MKIRSFLYKKVKALFADYFRIILNDTDFYGLNYVLELKIMIQRAFMFVSSNLVKGDYYEFGLYRGRSFLFALKESPKRNMHCYGFDSFEGLPAEQSYEDKQTAMKKLKWKKGDYACSEDELESILSKEHPSASYTLVKGFYRDSLTKDLQNRMNGAAIVHIDCDLYESAKEVLVFIKPLLQDGTILLFDDYYCFKGNRNHGEALALNEFVEQNEGIEVTPWFPYHCFGKSFIVTVK